MCCNVVYNATEILRVVSDMRMWILADIILGLSVDVFLCYVIIHVVVYILKTLISGVIIFAVVYITGADIRCYCTCCNVYILQMLISGVIILDVVYTYYRRRSQVLLHFFFFFF